MPASCRPGTTLLVAESTWWQSVWIPTRIADAFTCNLLPRLSQGCGTGDTVLRATAQVMVDKKLKDAGYIYVRAVVRAGRGHGAATRVGHLAHCPARLAFPRLGPPQVNSDDCWLLAARDANGDIQPDPAKFPAATGGINGTIAFIHSLGMKAGLYTARGHNTCAGYAGACGHEAQGALLCGRVARW